MDSPKIAIHIVLPNDTDDVREANIDGNRNRLYFSLSQPVGSHICGISLPKTASILSKTPASRTGMLGPVRSNCNSNKTTQPTIGDNSASASRKAEDRDNYCDSSKMACETPMKRLKKKGWYYGSISPEFSAKLLETEEDGSFLIRDSSSDCYIFSMTYKLDGEVHHTRIEHSKGRFSLGKTRKFFCTTLVDLIENAIKFSQNENLLFFLHRDPASEGPLRLRMKPLLRMNNLTSLKHLCRFAILPYVRKNKINELCIPGCLKDYLNEPFI
jgi:suppressor of cytokine signaling 7